MGEFCVPKSQSIPVLRACLLDLTQPIAKRTHAAFFLRTMVAEPALTDDATAVILEAVQVRQDTILMRHELAYILGQMQNPKACPVLSAILDDEHDDILVRHEAAEALGAIGDPSVLDVILKHCSHSAPDISETCQIARDLIFWRQEVAAEQAEGAPKSLYLSVDPAPPLPRGAMTLEQLSELLIDPSKSLFHRYRAMFTLRDMNNDEASLALVRGFQDTSALFRHEIAYVLGQMQRPCTIPGLEMVLADASEHRMVRHEAAESLGAIGGDQAEAILQKYAVDDEQIVIESCEVALDTMDYWLSEGVSGIEVGSEGESSDTKSTMSIKHM